MAEPQVTGDWPPAGGTPDGWPVVPGYQFLAELGRGGMGVVYKARQVGPDRLVALKVIRDGALAGPQARARFRTEAEAVTRLSHPNIVRVYEVGEHAGLPYLAMELVEGGTLDRNLGGRPLPPRGAAELVRLLARAVAHAHERMIVHRDLKPANILLGRKYEARSTKAENEDDTGLVSDFEFRISDLTPKVSDFGLAKRIEPDATACTQDGAVLGTPNYMAPEQAAGRVRDVGPAADVYALGATLYELLTGRPPFLADSREEIVQQVLHEEPVPPSRRQPDVPRDLETVCLKCLEKDPARRYAAAGELADDLDRFLAARPVAAVPPSPAERLGRLAQRDGYRIVGEAGRGPRSTVYHVRSEPLDRPAALKVLASGTCTRQEWEERLRRGAALGRVLAHPQILPVHRAGWWDDAPYLITEYGTHGSLAGALAGRPYHPRESLRLVGQLGELVGYLHRQGVVHGNLKPTNVLLAADGIPRIADFRLTSGLSLRPPSADDADTAGLAYLAPEFARDPAAEPRPHTDVYGLGAILYELLTGRPPFGGTSAGEVLEDVRRRDPVPPSYLNPAVPPTLEWVCLRCLIKDPWHRFPRAYDVVSRLRQLADDPDEGGGRGRRPSRDDAS